MLIVETTPQDIGKWTALAAEIESIYQTSMAGDPGFHEHMKVRVTNREAFKACDREDDLALMGIIAFSRKHNRITWLSVHEEYRNRGDGSKRAQEMARQ